MSRLWGKLKTSVLWQQSNLIGFAISILYCSDSQSGCRKDVRGDAKFQITAFLLMVYYKRCRQIVILNQVRVPPNFFKTWRVPRTKKGWKTLLYCILHKWNPILPPQLRAKWILGSKFLSARFRLGSDSSGKVGIPPFDGWPRLQRRIPCSISSKVKISPPTLYANLRNFMKYQWRHQFFDTYSFCRLKRVITLTTI